VKDRATPGQTATRRGDRATHLSVSTHTGGGGLVDKRGAGKTLGTLGLLVAFAAVVVVATWLAFWLLLALLRLFFAVLLLPFRL
jgi:hypothetical protein